MNKIIKHSLPSVSIVTITQLSRHKCLIHLAELIRLQQYRNIVEWVIVEGSNSSSDANCNALHIQQLQEQNRNKRAKMNIQYIEYTGLPLSNLRNLGNQQCVGDIIVCMDDDDYYPPTRVSHSVNRLFQSPKLIAGCSSIYIYDYDGNQAHQFQLPLVTSQNNHSTNNCFAFKREYLNNHTHAEGLHFAEESSFTNGFSEPMIQLKPEKCIVVSCHGNNTYDKRPILPNCKHVFLSSELVKGVEQMKELFI